MAQLVKILLQCQRPGRDPWVGRIPWRRESLSTPYSGLENSKDCVVPGVTKSQTRLSDFHLQILRGLEGYSDSNKGTSMLARVNHLDV